LKNEIAVRCKRLAYWSHKSMGWFESTSAT